MEMGVNVGLRNPTVEFEIPSDAEVLAAIKANGGAISPIKLLSALIASDHSRANAQWAIQRCLDREKIDVDLDLNFFIPEDAD